MTKTINAPHETTHDRSVNLITPSTETVSFTAARKMAKENNGELTSLSEIIRWLDKNSLIKGNYWLGDRPELKIKGPYKMNYHESKIEKVTESQWKNLPKEQKVWVTPGNGPWLFNVGYGPGDGFNISGETKGYEAMAAIVELGERKKPLRERAKQRL